MATQSNESVRTGTKIQPNAGSDLVCDPPQDVQPRRLSLVGKLAEACDRVGGVEKLGKNEMQNYKYVKAADVAKAIRHELFSRGVVILCNEIEFRHSGDITTKSGGILREFVLTVEYTIRDSESDEQITVKAFGVAMDSGDKAKYKCSTSALKYFLRGLGLIPDEKDDPEADEAIDKSLGKVDKGFKREFAKATTDQARRITPAEAKVFWQAIKKGGKTEAQVKAYFRSLKIEATEEMLYSDYDMCLKWAVGMEKDFSETLKKSVESVDAPLSDKHNFAKLFALAAKNNVPRDDVRKIGHEIYHVESLNELTAEQFEALTEWVEQQVGA